MPIPVRQPNDAKDQQQQARVSSLEHLAKAIHGLRWLESYFSVYAAYLDRSGSDKDGHVVVAGLADTTNAWLEFEQRWTAALLSEGAPYYHAKEFAHFTGAFATGWRENEPRRRRLIKALTDSLRSVRYGIAVVVIPEEFEKANRTFCLDARYQSPFVFAGRECAEYVRDWLMWGAPYSRHRPIEFVFDRGEHGWGNLCDAFTTDGLPRPIEKPSRDDKRTGERGVVQLQAADFLAYESFKMFKLDPKVMTIRKSAELLFQNMMVHEPVFGAFEIGCRCEERGIPRRADKA